MLEYLQIDPCVINPTRISIPPLPDRLTLAADAADSRVYCVVRPSNLRFGRGRDSVFERLHQTSPAGSNRTPTCLPDARHGAMPSYHRTSDATRHPPGSWNFSPFLVSPLLLFFLCVPRSPPNGSASPTHSHHKALKTKEARYLSLYPIASAGPFCFAIFDDHDRSEPLRRNLDHGGNVEYIYHEALCALTKCGIVACVPFCCVTFFPTALQPVHFPSTTAD